METLGKLFGNDTKVKLIKLFIFNPEEVLDLAVIKNRVQSDLGKVRKEMIGLEKAKLVKRKHIQKRGGKKKLIAYSLNQQFQYLEQLQNFFLNSEQLQPKEIVRQLKRLGSVKLVLVAGVFIQDPESRIDLLIVGDRIRPAGLESTIRKLESEIGKELKYAYFTTQDFKYRLSMYDKLTRDIFDYPHKLVVDKLGVL